MTSLEPSGTHRRIDPGLRRDAFASLCAIFAAAVPGYLFWGMRLSTGPAAVVSAALLLLVIFALVIHALPNHGHQRFGYANVVTAIRAAIVSLLAMTVLFAVDRHALEPALPTLIILVAVTLALDGVDGHVARRYRQVSALGARFDMEIDALLILTLSAASLLFGKAGWWVLLIGAMRYGFVLGQSASPRLRAPLPASTRRKLICVVQVVALCVSLAPMLVPPVSSVIAAVALALLSYSFAVDTLFLLRQRKPSP
jgi:phosphatidylglycerophosphate synthase